MPRHPAGKSAGHPTPLPVESGPSGARGHHQPQPPRPPAPRHLLLWRPGRPRRPTPSSSGPAPRQAEGRLSC